jgi:hypothetical protein
MVKVNLLEAGERVLITSFTLTNGDAAPAVSWASRSSLLPENRVGGMRGMPLPPSTPAEGPAETALRLDCPQRGGSEH